MRAKAESSDPADREDLSKVFGFFTSEYNFVPVDTETIPFADLAEGLAKPDKAQVLHNFGALQSLARLAGMTATGGFLLINDYGHVDEGATESFEHQRLSLATSVGLNFPLLKAFAKERGLVWVEPKNEYGQIYSRLVGAAPYPQTIAKFQEIFAKETFEKADLPALRARAFAKAGYLERGIAEFGKALDAEPYNWLLYLEAAEFALYGMV